MSTAKPTLQSSTRYSRQTIQRTQRAVACSPFLLHLFTTMCWQSVALKAIASFEGLNNGYTRRRIPERAAESELLWLIEVGMLRREVDGQGLTDSFRLTPLGRHLLNLWHDATEIPAPSLLDRFYNLCSRWLRFPDWL